MWNNTNFWETATCDQFVKFYCCTPVCILITFNSLLRQVSELLQTWWRSKVRSGLVCRNSARCCKWWDLYGISFVWTAVEKLNLWRRRSLNILSGRSPGRSVLDLRSFVSQVLGSWRPSPRIAAVHPGESVNRTWRLVSFMMTPARVLRRVSMPEPEKVNPLALPWRQGDDLLGLPTVWMETVQLVLTWWWCKEVRFWLHVFVL